jgi:hypothetical protein
LGCPMTSNDLYDDDILWWSERQAELLRRVAAGETPNEAPDWNNIIDEVESLGRSETRACTSALVQMLLHELKLAAWPNSTAVPGWRDEVSMRRMEAADAFAPSMRRKIAVADLFARALHEFRKMPATIDGLAPLPVPETCERTLDDLLADHPA